MNPNWATKADFVKEQMNFIIRNHLMNAIKYSFCNSVIAFEISLSDIFMQCAGHGTGTGIGKGTQNSLFQNSFPESKPGTNTEKGSGLGLKLCKEFVESNNGEIWIESEPGKGSSFYFTLPLLQIIKH